MTARPDPAMLRPAQTGSRGHRLAWRLHSLFGLKLSLLMAFVCATGTVATVAHEIEWLLVPAVRGEAAAPGATRNWGRVWAAARAAHSDGWVRGVGPYDRSDAGYFARAAAVALPDGREVTVLVDAASGQVTGEQRGVTFHSFMRALHYYLFVPGDAGFYLVTSLALALAGSLVTGLIVYRRFWRGLWRRPRFDRPVRTWLGDVHRLLGVWSIPFAAVIAATGLWYLAERAVLHWETPPPLAGPLRVQPGAATIDRWVAIAAEAMPGFHITGVSLPYGDGAPVIVQGQWQAWLVRERTNAAYIDPASGRLLGRRVAHDLTATERWVHTADPLHFGTFGGLATRLLWAGFGVALTLIASTGALINARRLMASDSVLAGWQHSLGWALLPTVALILAIPAWFYSHGWDAGTGAQASSAGAAQLGDQAFGLTRHADPDGVRWCARPLAGAAPAELTFRTGAGAWPAHFEAGAFCATLPPGSKPLLARPSRPQRRP